MLEVIQLVYFSLAVRSKQDRRKTLAAHMGSKLPQEHSCGQSFTQALFFYYFLINVSETF